MMAEKQIDDVHHELQARMISMIRARNFLEGADALRKHDLSPTATLAVTDIRDRKLLGNGGGGAGGWGDPITAYIPRLSERQTQNDYHVYLMGALYPNYLSKIRQDFRGLIFSRAPVIELPPSIEPMLEDCDLRGTPIEEELENIVDELYSVSRYGWWVDMPEVPEGMNKKQAESMAIRPFLVRYKSEDIVNWEYGYVHNNITLTRVVLREDPETYRELFLDRYIDDSGQEAYAYKTRIWRKAKNASPGTKGEQRFVPNPDNTPMRAGKPIQEIPFYFFSPFGGSATPEKPMLDDLVMVSWSLYRSSALLEHARFTCGLATAVALGFNEDTDIVLGGLNVLRNTNPEASFEWAERKGDDCLPLERAMEQKTQMLMQMGSRMIEEAKKAAESAEALRIRSSGDTATCADVAQGVGRIASQALAFCAWWLGDDSPKVEIKLTTDYANNVADPAEITALNGAVISNTFTQTDFNRRMRKVGIIEADRTDQDIAMDLALAAERDTGTLE